MNLKPYYFNPENSIELRAFTHGLMPRTVPAMMQHFTNDWAQLGVDAWNEVPNHWLPESGEEVSWWTLPEYLGDRFIAPMLQAEQGTCIMIPNVHWAVSSLLSCKALFKTKRELVVSADAFPSVLHTVQQWQALLGLEVRMVPFNAAGELEEEAILAAISDQTALVFLSHVGFTTSRVWPDAFLKEVASRTQEKGGLCAIDGFHATGSLPINVQDLGIDLYFGGLLKEASGSSGNGYLYIRPNLDLQPLLSGWFGDAAPFNFEPCPKWHPTVRRRFLGGTTPIAPLYHAVEGLRILLAAGLGSVRAHSLQALQVCLAAAAQAGLNVHSPYQIEQSGAMFILEVVAADQLSAYLKTQGIYTDSRQGRFLRLAPFVWNPIEEVKTAMEHLVEAVQTQKYLKFSGGGRGIVT